MEHIISTLIGQLSLSSIGKTQIAYRIYDLQDIQKFLYRIYPQDIILYVLWVYPVEVI